MTPPRSARPTASTQVGDSFTSEEAVNLASMLNVRVEAAVDALKRNQGDVNAAAEWLLTMPTYVEVNSVDTVKSNKALIYPETVLPEASFNNESYTYGRNNIKVIEAELDEQSGYVPMRKPEAEGGD